MTANEREWFVTAVNRLFEANPVPDRAPRLGLRLLRAPDSLVRDFPTPSIAGEFHEERAGDIPVLAHIIQNDPAAAAPPPPSTFDAICSELAVYGLTRDDLVRLTDVPVAFYGWALDVTERLSCQRPQILAHQRSYEGLARRIQRARYLSRDARHVALREIVLILRYLRQWPTENELRDWRRRLGIDKDARGPRQRQLARLKVWTNVAEALVEHIDKALGAYSRRAFLPRGATAARYATRLLHARYPQIIPNNPEALRSRIR